MSLSYVVLLAALIVGPGSRFERPPNGQRAADMFAEIADALSAGDISHVSSAFASQVHVTLRGGESGLFSANQAYALLQRYLHDRSASACTFTESSDSSGAPYATGTILLSSRGRKERAQVYVALARERDRWAITHITIY
jgi:hypothetical protein